MTLFWALSAVVFCGITTADMLVRGSAHDTLVNSGLLVSLAVSSGQLLFTR